MIEPTPCCVRLTVKVAPVFVVPSSFRAMTVITDAEMDVAVPRAIDTEDSTVDAGAAISKYGISSTPRNT